MATSTINTNWTTITGKNATRQSALVSKLKETVVCVTFGMCEDYPACAAGFTVDLSACGRITTIIDVQVGNLTVGACCNTVLATQYVAAACDAAATGTLHLFEGPTCVGSLSEIADCDCRANCKSIKFHVTGF